MRRRRTVRRSGTLILVAKPKPRPSGRGLGRDELVYFLIHTTMKKQDFVKEVAAAAKLSQDAASKTLEAMISIVTDQLKKGGEVGITGFGTFAVSERAARTGVNPKTRQPISIPKMNSPVFRAGKTLKDEIR